MVRNGQILKHILKVMRAGLADRRGVGCNRKSDVKENMKVLSLSHRGSPLPEEEARGRPRLRGIGVQNNLQVMRLD